MDALDLEEFVISGSSISDFENRDIVQAKDQKKKDPTGKVINNNREMEKSKSARSSDGNE